jgi:hypothetical protein
MYYEDVKVKHRETVSGLATAYGYRGDQWKTIWDDPKNHDLVVKRGKPEHLQVSDVLFVKIPWKVNSKVLNVEAGGVGFTVTRDGGAGKRLAWVQTVYRDNQPIGPNPSPFCVDACTPDDNLPFYWTDAEIKKDATRRKTFIDHPSRPAPSAAKGTTRWRAIVSIAVQTEKRITVYDSNVWGFDLTPANVATKIGPRAATVAEINGHLTLLRNGLGTAKDTFGKQGWTFRTPP